MRLGPPPEEPEIPGQFWKDFIRDTAPLFRRPTIEQLGSFLQPTWQALIDGSKYVNERIVEIFDELQPDAIVEDNVVAFPAIAASGRPWARIVSCNPLELRDEALPPVFSGYPAADSHRVGGVPRRARPHARRDVARLRRVRARARGSGPSRARVHARVAAAQHVRLPRGGGLPAGGAARTDVASARVHRCGRRTSRGACRTSSPAHGKLVYLSLGSLASADLELMQRLVGMLAGSPHRFVVSKGPQHELLELADNMWGAEFLPQASILPQADLVITHGGNNTTTECFYFGKPMVVLPVFWDQYDNAQRVDELGLGRRLDTYRCSADELTGAIDDLLSDAELERRLEAMSARLQTVPGTVKAADLIERLARTGEPVV